MKLPPNYGQDYTRGFESAFAEVGKRYKVAGWASINEQTGAPVWDVVARHLQSGKPPSGQTSGVTLKGVDDNPGIAGQG